MLLDEPPFFLRNSSSETTPPDVLLQRTREVEKSLNPLFTSNNTVESGSDEYRSVIDDLTIENKRLKRRLKQLERTNSPSLEKEALFEVRFHGLAADKRRELEQMLRDFAVKVGQSPQPSNPSGSGIKSSKIASLGVPTSLLAGPTSTSASRKGDSGYASMGRSGQNMSEVSGKARESGEMGNEPMTKQDIHTYLSEIPLGLLPMRGGPMSDKEKKKIVVRRLEQLFAGRSPSGAHQQPQQQQKVAQSAARSDRKATEASGESWLPEGSREAPIMYKQQRLAPEADPSASSDSRTKSDPDQDVQIEDSALLHEQRPTRPLDLDPYRAQVPSENIHYMRHLGFSPPYQEDDMEARPDGHGWIYLNMLTNMAQLHFTNVTPSFIQKSIAEYSKKLELSEDGRKVRWRGGTDVTRTSSDNNSPNEEIGNPMAAVQTKHSLEHGSKGSMKSSETSSKRRGKDKLAYSPLFRTRQSSEPETGMSDEMIYQTSGTYNPSSMPTRYSVNTGKSRQLAREDSAPLIFYQNMTFFTDLSGDPTRAGARQSSYKPMPTVPIGTEGSKVQEDIFAMHEYEKGPLSWLNTKPRVSSSDHSSSSPQEPSIHIVAGSKGSNQNSLTSSNNPDDLMDFEASGIGGIEPADNFAINVRSRQNKSEGSEIPFAAKRAKGYSKIIRNALVRRSRISTATSSSGTSKVTSTSAKKMAGIRRSTVQREILASKTINMPASALPDAVFFHTSSEDEYDDEDDDEDMEDDEIETSESGEMPQTAPQHMNWAVLSRSNSSESEADSEAEDSKKHTRLVSRPPNLAAHENSSSSAASHKYVAPWLNKPGSSLRKPGADSSLSDESSMMDILAHARTVDPENVRIREREFDAQAADRLAHDIPAGSSAATAGGGSGFMSPAYVDVTNLPGSSTLAVTGSLTTSAGAERVQDVTVRPGTKRNWSDEGPTPVSRKSPKLSHTSGSDDDDDDDNNHSEI